MSEARPSGPPHRAPPPVAPPLMDGVPPRWAKRVRTRPWWGLGDVALGVPFFILASLLGGFIALPFVGFDASATETGDLALPVLVTSLMAQQLAQGVWPFLVSKWKGRGPVKDWRLAFAWFDPFIGLGIAILAVVSAAIVSEFAARAVGLVDDAEADNTQFLKNAEGSPWLYVLLFGAVVGAPLAEEFFFRGLTLRAFEKRAGPVVAVLGSTVVFTLPHFIGTGLAGTVVLLTAIGTVGLILGTITVVTGRIWPAVFGHMLFNMVGAAGALGALDGLTGP